jgi:hypothetical protein
VSGSVCRVPYSLSAIRGRLGLQTNAVRWTLLAAAQLGSGAAEATRQLAQQAGFALRRQRQYLWHQLHRIKTKKPCQGRVSFGPAATAIALAKVSGNLCLEGRDRDLVSNSVEKTLACLASSLPRYLFPTLGIKMLWARESNSYRSRGSLHGSRYSRSGATRKGEKAMAGQRKTPTTGAVTVSEPTDRQTPKRAGSAVVTHSRKSGTPVGSGSRVPTWNSFPTAWSHARRFF